MTKIPFLPWVNDNGLVCGTLADGGVSFYIYDADNQPINGDLEGDDKVNQAIAAGMVVAVNNHKALVGALAGYKKLTRSAQDILVTYLTPDGYDADAAVSKLLALLDGPHQREVEGKARMILSQVG